MTNDTDDRLERLIRPVVEGLGCTLWGIEYRPQKRSALLRVFIDKDDGVGMDDCERVSRQLSAMLDVEDPIPVAYTLEVSSPGIDRVLFTPEQFRRYRGEKAKIRLRWPVQERRNYEGTIRGAEDDRVLLEQQGEVVEIPMEAISRARLKGRV